MITVQVKLLTPVQQLKQMEYNAAYAMLMCHANTDRLEHNEPRYFLEKAIRIGHESILEHITLTYEIRDLSRACLQELARHRLVSLSVESTRNTLKRALDKYIDKNGKINKVGRKTFSPRQREHLYELAYLSGKGYSNDELKYYLPEFWPTNLVLSANVRELRHVITLRTSTAALMEFRKLARKFVSALPDRDEFGYLLADCVQ